MEGEVVNRLGVFSMCCLLLVLSACGGGGGGTPWPAPQAGALTASAAGTAGVVYGPPGAADAGSPVRTPGAVVVQGTAQADGSFTLRIDPHPAQIVVAYVKQGLERTQTVQFVDLSNRVTKPLFSTGAAPNDMLLAGADIYVANSLDNTVVRYSLAGAVQATASFPQYASPSFLALTADRLWVVANGDNTLSAYDAQTLNPIAGAAFTFADPAAAFIGPSQPAVAGAQVFVPRNQILTFAPTAYGPGRLSVCDTATAAQSELATTGLNAQYCAVDSARSLLYVVCTGEIQFDEQYVPHAAGDSTFEIFDLAQGLAPVASLNLGPVGAGRIALSPDGAAAYLGNGLNGNVYKVDLGSRGVARGADNPIVLTGEYTYVSDLAFTPDGRFLLAASFNTDELYVIDPATDAVHPGPYLAPFDLSLAPDMLAGCANVEVGARPGQPGKYDAYVLYAVGNAVARVELY